MLSTTPPPAPERRSSIALMIVSVLAAGAWLVAERWPSPPASSLSFFFVAAVLVAAGLVAFSLFRRPTKKAAGDFHTDFLQLAEADQDALFLLVPVLSGDRQIEDFNIRFHNAAAHKLLTQPVSGGPSSLFSLAVPGLAGSGFLYRYRHTLETGASHSDEFAFRPERNNEFPVTELASERPDEMPSASWLRTTVTRFDDGLLLTITDLTRQKEVERELCRQAQHDPLTGLPNRALLDDRIQQALRRAKRNNQSAAVLMLDIDHFKLINDVHGHSAGDHVLKIVAKRLCEAVRSTDSVFRLGGDEFVLIFPDVYNHNPVTDFARKIVVAMFSPIPWKDLELTVSASIGVAMYPTDGATPEALLIHADIEMYRMKRRNTGKSSPRELNLSSLDPHALPRQ